MSTMRTGMLAAQAGFRLPLQVLQSAAGFYLGTCDQEGPVSRESAEYFASERQAVQAMASGHWTQRPHP